ncbi:MAG: serine/threonine-protein kinase [Polyangiales bacterium]
MEDSELSEGTPFGQYRIVKRLGSGAMGAVYAAEHTGLHKRVVLKVLHAQHARSPSIRSRFAREGRAAASIRHPNVVDVTDVGLQDGTPYLIMELLEGESLGDLLGRHGALAVESAVDLMLPVIAGVEAAHASGVVHRDLKPDNIFVTRDATGAAHPKVLDFGISRVAEGDDGRHTGTDGILGTPTYMAPEQIERARDADARTDQYALGVTLYECLTGAVPFAADNVYKLLVMVREAPVTAPRALRPELPPALDAAVLRAMARDPEARFPTLRAFMAALLPFASERARVLWGDAARLAQSALVTPAALAPGLAPALAPGLAPAPVDAPDTVVDSLVVATNPRTSAQQRPRRDARPAVAVAIAAALLLGGVIVARTAHDQGKARGARAATAAVSGVPATHAPPAVEVVDAQVAPPPIEAPAAPAAPAAPTHARGARPHAAGHAPSNVAPSAVVAPPVAPQAPTSAPPCTGPDCQHPVE